MIASFTDPAHYATFRCTPFPFRAISWRSVKQSSITDSTMEAEYIAADGKWCAAEGSVVSGIREGCDHGFQKNLQLLHHDQIKDVALIMALVHILSIYNNKILIFISNHKNQMKYIIQYLLVIIKIATLYPIVESMES